MENEETVKYDLMGQKEKNLRNKFRTIKKHMSDEHNIW